MTILPLPQVLAKAEQFVRKGCQLVTKNEWHTAEEHLISPCPVSSGLAIMALTLKSGLYAKSINKGIAYLEASQNPDGGWGRTPGAPSDETSSKLCQTAIASQKSGVSAQAISIAGTSIATTWMQDIPRLVLDWPPDSPMMQLIEAFILNEKISHAFTELTFEHFPIVLNFLPPGGKPLILALACIREASRKKRSRSLQSAMKKLMNYQSPNGSWGEDIVMTSLAALCLSQVGRYPEARNKALRWLSAVQYASGAWPSFNQLINWDAGLTAYTLREYNQEEPDLVLDCANFLSTTIYQDGSYGTLSPYSYPDLDDTAISLLGLSAAVQYKADLVPLVEKSSQLLLALQNNDGSWGTFPEVSGHPPNCTSQQPVYIKSVDVTVHVLQALIHSGVHVDTEQLKKGLWWLVNQQQWDGSWKSTWYLGNTYATAQTLELLTDCNLWPKTRVRTKKWLLTHQQADGAWPSRSAGECSLALTALLKNNQDPQSESIRKGFTYLSSIQQPNGSFTPFYQGFYLSGLYYEAPLTEALAVIRAIKTYQKVTARAKK